MKQYYCTIHPFGRNGTHVTFRYATELGARTCSRGLARLLPTAERAARAGFRCMKGKQGIVAVWRETEDWESPRFVKAYAELSEAEYKTVRGRERVR